MARKRIKPLRPGENCPTCEALVKPHCPKWGEHCSWVVCTRCKAYGTASRWTGPLTDAQEDPEVPDLPSPDVE